MNGSEIKNMTITGETTVGDLEINDRDNFKKAVVDSNKIYTFGSLRSALKLMGLAMNQIMTKCGVEIKRGGDSRLIDRLLKKEGVKVEERTYPADEGLYRSGLYVYKRGELMGFVSGPFRKISNLHIRNRFHIMTTERDL